jgi:hypothetical protein
LRLLGFLGPPARDNVPRSSPLQSPKPSRY